MKNQMAPKTDPKTELNSNRSLVYTALSVLALTFATACGGVDGPIGGTGSPTKNYRDLGPAIPKAEVPPPAPPTPTPAPHVEPKTEVNQVVFPRPTIVELDQNQKEVEALPRFVEGESREYLIKTQVFAKDVVYDVKIEGLPTSGSNPVTFKALNDPKRPGYYVLSWTPKVGTLSRDESNGRDYTGRLTFVIMNKNKEALPLIVQKADGLSFNFKATLVRNDRSPRIVNIALASDVMFIGDKNLVTVSVTDPSASGRDVPEVIVTDEVGGSSEKPVLHVGKFVQQGEREYKNGTFYFKMMLDTRPLLDQVANLKNETEARFVVRVVGATSGKATAATKSLTLVKKQEPVAEPTAASPTPAPTRQTPTQKSAPQSEKGAKS